MNEVILLLAVGLFSGLFGGMLGIGGSIILLPALTIFFAHRHSPEHQHVYQGAAMIMNLFVAIPSVIAHRRQGAMLPALLKWLIPAGIVSITLGVMCSNLQMFRGDGAVYLKRLLGLFLFYVLGYNTYRLLTGSRLADVTPEAAKSINPLKTIFWVGFPMGFSGGLLGIGGGALCVPLQQVLLKIPLHRAIANSSATILWTSLIGAIYKNMTIPSTVGGPWAALKLSLFVVPTSFIGGYLGARLIYVLPRHVVRIAFIILMLYAGLKLIRS